MNLITDRKQSDVARLEALSAKMTAGTAAEGEQAEWRQVAKRGSYGKSDIERVNNAMSELAGMLRARGYEITLAPLSTEALYISAPQAKLYIDNIRAVRSVLVLPDDVPAAPLTLANLTIDGANNIEKILLAVEEAIKYVDSSSFYLGEVYAGEVQ